MELGRSQFLEIRVPDFDASESLEKSKKIEKSEKRCSEKNRLLKECQDEIGNNHD